MEFANDSTAVNLLMFVVGAVMLWAAGTKLSKLKIDVTFVTMVDL
nr:hypothetical protein [Rhodopirellula sp. SM50]